MSQLTTERPKPADAGHRYVGTDLKMLIDGEWVAAASGRMIDAIDPATEEVICRVPAGDAEDVDRAVKAARRAFEGSAWGRILPIDRERLLHRLADLIEEHGDEIAWLESRDNGKPYVHARTRDVRSAVNRLRYCAGWPTKIAGRTTTPSIALPGAEFSAAMVKEPVGVVGQIIPWNFPFQMAVGKIAPALAAGCTVVLKPAEQTSLSALLLGELIEKAGIPSGVVNIVTGLGSEAGQAIVDHPDVDKVAFTGSTATGKLIGRAAMATLKRVSLELGGKSPVIIGPGADLRLAIPGAANAIFYNAGQVCIAGSRLYVHRPMFHEVMNGIAEIAKNTVVGPGMDAGSELGPVVSKVQRDRVMGYVQQGIASGAELWAGGTTLKDKGYFVAPTVLSGLADDHACVREEIFGPVLVADAYDEADEIARRANDTTYGLAASVWTSDLSFAHRMARRLRAGTVCVNCHGMLDATLPFGGYKQSGIGRESGAEGIDLYLERKSIVIRI